MFDIPFLSRKLFSIIILLCVLAGITNATESFDYTKIAPHPRILMSKNDEDQIKKVIKTNVNLAAVHAYIIDYSDKLLAKEPLVYEKKGKRLLAVSREALQRVFYLSYSYRMTKDKKYLKRAELEMDAVCKFDDWNPSHYLDVGEMTMAVAIGYDWLFDSLDKTMKAKIEKAILKNAFETSNNKEYDRFKSMTNNWNQVCNAGLVYGALAIFESAEKESKGIIEEAIRTNPLSMAGYGPDGNYPEGAMYWSYGTSFEVMMIAALESALGSDKDMSQAPGFLKSAEFMLFVNGPVGKRFNFSDCGANQMANIAQFWFAKKTNNPNLLFSEIQLLNSGAFLKSMEEDRLLPAIFAFSKNVDFSNITAPTKKVWSGKGITPVILVRTDWNNKTSEYLGIKGGSASAHHSHMDAGTFVYDSEGFRWAMDFGLQSYGVIEGKGIDLWNKEQGSQRWDVFRLNNKNHNTLTINDKRHNVEGFAEIINVFDSPEERGGTVDLSSIFKGEISKAIRKVVLKNDIYLQVEDEISANDKDALVRWTMVTPANIKILDKSSIELTQKGKKKILKVVSNFPFELKSWNSENPGNDYEAKNPGTIMIGFEAKVPANQKANFVVTLKN